MGAWRVRILVPLDRAGSATGIIERVIGEVGVISPPVAWLARTVHC